MCLMHVPYPGVAKILVAELDSRFPAHHFIEALGLVYPQYWCIEDARENFEKHMHIIKARVFIYDGHGKKPII